MVKNVMSGKLKLKGHLKHLARWPLYLSVLLIALNVLVYVISIKAGIVVTMGIILYVGAAIGLLFYHRPLMFNDLIAFASQYEFLEKRVLEEFALPYAVMDMQGRMIWSNKVFSQITGRDQFYRKNVNTILQTSQQTSFRQDLTEKSQRSVHSLESTFIVYPCRESSLENPWHHRNF